MTNLQLISKKKQFLFFLTFLFFSFGMFAQKSSVTVAGKVIDEASKEPLSGVTVLVKSSKTGVTTDIDGNFTFNIKSLPETIIINYVGFKTLEVDVYEYTEPLTIELHENRNFLNEVVVVGYGSQKRKELTGSVASLDKIVLQQSAISIDDLLGGAISGVNVTQTSGQPGAGSEIRIRGGNSIYASNEPLYVIDGFIYFSEKGATQAGVSGIENSLNPLASLNPSDIESVEILKDVSAKAIYGSRGANGVILVTTKKGKRGGNTIHYQYSIGIDKSAKKLNLLNAEQWTEINQKYFNKGTWGQSEFIAFNDAQLAATGKKPNGNWQDAVLQTGSTQTHELSISGGDEKTRYLLSGNYTNQEGIVLNSGFKRFSGRINLDKELYSNLTVGVTVSADRSTQNALTTMTADEKAGASSSPFKSGITNSLVYALFMPPVIPIHDATTGDYTYYNPFELSELNYYGKAANPVSDLKNSIGQTINTSLLGNFYAKYNIPTIEGLAVKFSAGTNINYITQNFFAPPYSALGINDDIQGRGSVGNRKTDVSQTEYLLTYTKQLTPIHYIDLLGGYTNQETNTDIMLSKVDHLKDFNLLAESVGLKKLFNRTDHASLHSILTRANYTLLEKYNLTATWRADKSSRFAKGHQWGHFPSIGFSWNVSDEKFAKPLFPVLNSLKFRATYGTSGNQEIGFAESLQNLDPSGRYNGEAAYIVDNLGNDKLTWETTTEYNAGVDAGFLNDRLNFVADIYYKKTSDLLVKVRVPFAITEDLQTFNIGNVTNKGFELALNAKLITQRKFTWAVSANFARNINTITSLGEDYNDLKQGDQQEKTLRVGESVGSFYGFIYDGVDQENGDIKLRNLDDDPQITTGGDRTIIGSIQPDFTYGLSSNLTYRRWDVFASLQGSQGNEVYNKIRRHLTEGNDTHNLSTEVLDAWTNDKPSNVPRITVTPNTNTLYSRYVEDASFLKIKNITLGYNLPIKIGEKLVQFRAFVSAQNLYTFTKYKGYDPEIAGGIDTGVYPTSRTFLLGAGITF
ncbi:MAG: TonB-dependent receptor [Tannerella sp.]|nr:TonB-dependent receptor [Tannerella sp.]